MEKQPHQEYRDTIANNLKSIEDKDVRKEELEKQQDTFIYKTAKGEHLKDIEKYLEKKEKSKIIKENEEKSKEEAVIEFKRNLEERQGNPDGNEIEKRESVVAGYKVLRLHKHGGDIESAVKSSGITSDDVKQVDNRITTSEHLYDNHSSGGSFEEENLNNIERAMGMSVGVPMYANREGLDVAGKIFSSLCDWDALEGKDYVEAFKRWGNLKEEIFLVCLDMSGTIVHYEPTFSHMGPAITHYRIVKGSVTDKDILILLK